MITLTSSCRHTASRRKRARAINWMRQGGRCAYCGAGIPLVVATLDHVTPKSQGGSNEMTNLVVSCIGCNHTKADGPAPERVA